MKKLVKFLLAVIIITAIGISLITTRPAEKDFAEWYVEQNQTGLGSFFDDAMELVVKQRTEFSDYLFFSVFEVDGEERYVGIWNHIFGRNSSQQVQDTLQSLIDQAKDVIEK